MLDLCEQLNITVNDLLCGEVVSMENYNKELEKNLIEMTRAKEEADKRLLRVEIVVGLLCVFVLFSFAMIASLFTMQEWLRIVLVFAGMLPLLIATPFMLKIEQVAGYYECRNCGHRYIPSYKAVNMAPHYGRTRKMRCPECSKKSWQKKVISKE
jgi:DNA-directed RNA polymerase subunit RPC12/RpoP